MSELLEAASMYVGHFLEADPYQDWSTDFRDELLSLSLELRREIARLLSASEHPDDAIPWLVGLLADDPYDEPTHRLLIGALDRAGRHGESRRFYRAYVERMAEIDVPPTPFTSLVDPEHLTIP